MQFDVDVAVCIRMFQHSVFFITLWRIDFMLLLQIKTTDIFP